MDSMHEKLLEELDSLGNWQLPNDSAIIALLRNAQLKIIGRPSKEVFICQPTKTFGKKVVDKKLVFPGYGKGSFDELVGQKF